MSTTTFWMEACKWRVIIEKSFHWKWECNHLMILWSFWYMTYTVPLCWCMCSKQCMKRVLNLKTASTRSDEQIQQKMDYKSILSTKNVFMIFIKHIWIQHSYIQHYLKYFLDPFESITAPSERICKPVLSRFQPHFYKQAVHSLSWA